MRREEQRGDDDGKDRPNSVCKCNTFMPIISFYFQAILLCD